MAESLLKRVGDTRVKKLTPKTRKKVTARVALDALRTRDTQDPCEEDISDEEMEDDEVAVSEMINDPTETNSDSEAPEKATSQNETKDTTPVPTEISNTDNDTTVPTNHGRKKKKASLKEKDEMEAFVYHRHETEAKEMEETTAVLAKSCREMDGIGKKTIDERNPNQTVTLILTEVKAFMKASIVAHTSRPSPALAADVSGPLPQPMKLTRKQATPKTVVFPLTCTPRKSPSQASPDTNKKETDTYKQSVREVAPLRAAHPLFIVKTVNSIGIESAAPVRSGIALTPKAGTTPEDLQNKDRISTSLGNGVEKDEKWVVVKIHDQMIALN
ncbi:hypothetical protein V8E54_007605 [Elaphomyces granulatus]